MTSTTKTYVIDEDFLRSINDKWFNFYRGVCIQHLNCTERRVGSRLIVFVLNLATSGHKLNPNKSLVDAIKELPNSDEVFIKLNSMLDEIEHMFRDPMQCMLLLDKIIELKEERFGMADNEARALINKRLDFICREIKYKIKKNFSS